MMAIKRCFMAPHFGCAACRIDCSGVTPETGREIAA
jgi:hypothetical protein